MGLISFIKGLFGSKEKKSSEIVVETPVIEETKVVESPVIEKVVEEVKVVPTPVVEPVKVEETKVEVEEPVKVETKVEEPVKVEETKVEEPVKSKEESKKTAKEIKAKIKKIETNGEVQKVSKPRKRKPKNGKK